MFVHTKLLKTFKMLLNQKNFFPKPNFFQPHAGSAKISAKIQWHTSMIILHMNMNMIAWQVCDHLAVVTSF